MITSVLPVCNLNSTLQWLWKTSPFMLPWSFTSVFSAPSFSSLNSLHYNCNTLETPVIWSNISVCFILLKSFYILLQAGRVTEALLHAFLLLRATLQMAKLTIMCHVLHTQTHDGLKQLKLLKSTLPPSVRI